MKMHDYQVIGINHRTANAALLSLLSLNGQRRAVFLQKIKEKTAFDGFVLSTCNRTELYFKNADPKVVLSCWAETLGLHKLPADKRYHHFGSAAVAHLFRVACGLDSKILGDNEIIGQLKEAFLFHKENYQMGGVWERIVNMAIECSRQVRKGTDFNTGSISTPYRIAKIIQQEGNAGAPVLLVGAGEMIQLCLKYFKKILPLQKLVIANRSIDNARQLADGYGADYFHFGQLESEMRKFPIVIAALQLERPFFHAGYLKKDGPQLLFDLGIPCNFTAGAAEQHRYFDIQTIADFNAAALERRSKDARKAAAIVAEKVKKWEAWQHRHQFYKHQISPILHENHHRFTQQQTGQMAG
jgi:glutamyl-tRNA reductase